MSERARTISIWDPGIVRQAVRGLVAEARSPDSGQEPGDVHRGGRQPPHDDHLHPGIGRRNAGGRSLPVRSPSGCGSPSLFANFAEAMAEGRGKAQADTLRKTRTETVANRLTAGERMENGAGGEPSQERRRDGPRRGVHSGGWRDHRRRRVGRRVGDHRRIGAGHSRIRRRSVGRHRWHARHLGLDQGARDLRSGAHLPGSHDRARRGRGAAEDAE